MGYMLSRTDKNGRALIQTDYLEGEHSTAQDMFDALASNYHDSHKKARASLRLVSQPLHVRSRTPFLPVVRTTKSKKHFY
jgi:hypothetical protein